LLQSDSSALITEAVDRLAGETVERLQELVRIPSVTGEEFDVQQAIARQMADIGLEVDQWEPDVDQLAPFAEDVGAFTSLAGRPNVVGRLRGKGGGRSLILNAHIDTVEAGDRDQWTLDPYSGEVHDGLMYGRGTCDMKAGLVAEIIAVRTLQNLGIELAGEVFVQSVISEEDGGAGALATILRGYTADGAIITEPTDLAIITAHGGSLVFRITITGRSAHACVRNEGVSVVEKFIPIHQALLALEMAHHHAIVHPLFENFANRAPINIGVVRAGNWASSVPESMIVEGRAGLVPGETLEETRVALLGAIDEVVQRDPWLREHPPTIEWFSGQFTASETPIDSPLGQTLSGAHRAVTGRPARFEAATYGADMRHFVNTGGIPCVMYGAGNVDRAHRPNEFVPMAQVLTVAKTLAVALTTWCNPI
jgi:acetylornithine deacetylase